MDISQITWSRLIWGLYLTHRKPHKLKHTQPQNSQTNGDPLPNCHEIPNTHCAQQTQTRKETPSDPIISSLLKSGICHPLPLLV